MQQSSNVLITAGASGIGRAIAAAFLAQGARVHVCDLSEPAIADLQREFPAISATRADVASVAEVDRVFAEFEQHHGRLDVLVNNAGIAGPTAAVEDIDPADWERCIAVTLNGQFHCARRAVPLLKRQGGSIINISSTAGLFGVPLRSPYVAAKWAIIGLTKTWAMELGPFGIRVNAICPGSVNGPRIDGVIRADAAQRGVAPEQIREVYLRQSSMRVFAEAEDVAQMALYLCSAAGERISGQALAIDGHTEGMSNWLS